MCVYVCDVNGRQRDGDIRLNFSELRSEAIEFVCERIKSVFSVESIVQRLNSIAATAAAGLSDILIEKQCSLRSIPRIRSHDSISFSIISSDARFDLCLASILAMRFGDAEFIYSFFSSFPPTQKSILVRLQHTHVSVQHTYDHGQRDRKDLWHRIGAGIACAIRSWALTQLDVIRVTNEWSELGRTCLDRQAEKENERVRQRHVNKYLFE